MATVQHTQLQSMPHKHNSEVINDNNLLQFHHSSLETIFELDPRPMSF